MRTIRWILLLALVASCGIAAYAQDFWIKKPYQQWSAEEAGRMTHDSPWAITTTLRAPGNPAVQITSPTGPAVVNDYESNGQTDTSVSYVLQLCSAPPIRQAMVRTSQLQAHYDALPAEKKAAFDASADKFLAATFPDKVEVCVRFHSNVDNYQSLLRTYWTEQTAPKLAATVYLTAGKERVPISGYACKGDVFQFTFPRPKQVDADRPIGVEFVHPTIDLIRSQRLLLNFKPKKMLINGEPAL